MKLFYITFIAVISIPVYANNLPKDFVYLSDIDSTILQEMRYAGSHNFIGRPIKGYESGECILTRAAAEALKNVQADLKNSGYTLKVYDCYRPQKAVNDFVAWSKQTKHQEMKAEFYPNVNKRDFFKLGYAAEKSGHTRGSTVDITIVSLPDKNVDMGTSFDYMDESSHSANQNISKTAYENRQRLFWVMEKYGFVNYPEEWWHLTLKNEPHANEYFNFNVTSNIPNNSRQLLMVRASMADTFKAEMQRYERLNHHQAWRAVGKPIPVVVGERGIASAEKKEGDMRTPAGVYKINTAFGFEKKDNKLKLAYQQLTNDTVCVDDPSSRFYNQIVHTVNQADWKSAEQMRQIPYYKLGAVIAFNEKHQPGLGSCIFMHIWRNQNKGTAGCVAMAEPELKKTLSWIDKNKRPVIMISAGA